MPAGVAQPSATMANAIDANLLFDPVIADLLVQIKAVQMKTV
jgi:hypothetical protein